MNRLVYISSDGRREEDPEEMHLAKFGNSIRKIERMGPTHPSWENLTALKAVFERRQAEWDAAHPEEGR